MTDHNSLPPSGSDTDLETLDSRELVALEEKVKKQRERRLRNDAKALAVQFEAMARELGLTARTVIALTRKKRSAQVLPMNLKLDHGDEDLHAVGDATA